MITNVLPSIFTIETGGTPMLVFEAKYLRGAHELCHEQWLKSDLAEAKSNGVPLWDGKATLRTRMALPDESTTFSEAKIAVSRLRGRCWSTLSNWTAMPLIRSPSILATFWVAKPSRVAFARHPCLRPSQRWDARP
jgi:hypothetical protein